MSVSKKERRNKTLKKQHTIPAPLALSASVGAWGHRNRKGEVTIMGAGAGSPPSQGATHPTWLHTVLKKRNLLMVRLEKTFLPEPSTAPSHNNLEPLPAQGQSALLPAKGKLASLGRWPGSTLWASQGAPEGRGQAGQPAGAAQLPFEYPFMPLLPTQAANTLASCPPKTLIPPCGWAKQQGLLPGIPVLVIHSPYHSTLSPHLPALPCQTGGTPLPFFLQPLLHSLAPKVLKHRLQEGPALSPH